MGDISEILDSGICGCGCPEVGPKFGVHPELSADDFAACAVERPYNGTLVID